MSNDFEKKCLKEWREVRQLTQQELADKAQVSIRTIQRIEKNISAGSPYVIKSLSKALEIDQANINLTGFKPEKSFDVAEAAAGERETVNKLKILNYSPIFVLFIPVLNIIVSFLFFLKYKKTLLNKTTDGKKIVSFQIFWMLGTLLMVTVIPALVEEFAGLKEYARMPLFFWLYLLCVCLNLVVILDTSVRLIKLRSILPCIPEIL